jgi:hypothetical protein
VPLVYRFEDLTQIRGRIGYYKFGNSRPPQSLCNLSRPDKSLLLRAPLSVEAGGLGWCGADVFATTDDPAYQQILARIARSGINLRRSSDPTDKFRRLGTSLGFIHARQDVK